MLIVLIPSAVDVEDILVKTKKPKTESVSKIKEQIAAELEELLKLSTQSIKDLAQLVDDIVIDVKQIAGQESGPLASADKKCLEKFREKVASIKNALQDLELECCLRV